MIICLPRYCSHIVYGCEKLEFLFFQVILRNLEKKNIEIEEDPFLHGVNNQTIRATWRLQYSIRVESALGSQQSSYIHVTNDFCGWNAVNCVEMEVWDNWFIVLNIHTLLEPSSNHPLYHSDLSIMKFLATFWLVSKNQNSNDLKKFLHSKKNYGNYKQRIHKFLHLTCNFFVNFSH